MKKLIITLILGFITLSISAYAKPARFAMRKHAARSMHRVVVANVINRLHYDFAKYTIRPQYNGKLEKLGQLMLKNNYSVALRGYADSLGSYKGNWVLSDKRANEVKDYLIKMGVAKDRIVATPFGSTNPIASNKTAEGRQINRRVEIIINSAN
jgi:outer membrane protein OmpA-like peptidoglycan-associated protein